MFSNELVLVTKKKMTSLREDEIERRNEIKIKYPRRVSPVDE